MTVIKAERVAPLGRGGGVVTIPLITRQSAAEENLITTGISTYPVGTGAPYHSHNCDEHVTLLEGEARGHPQHPRSVIASRIECADCAPGRSLRLLAATPPCAMKSVTPAPLVRDSAHFGADSRLRNDFPSISASHIRA